MTWPEVCQNGGRANSFKNLLLQTHLSECYQIWVTSLGHGHDVKLRRSCRSYDRKCVKMADLVKFLENHVNSFKHLPHQTDQSEFYQSWVATLGQGPDKLQVQWSFFKIWVPIPILRRQSWNTKQNHILPCHSPAFELIEMKICTKVLSKAPCRDA